MKEDKEILEGDETVVTNVDSVELMDDIADDAPKGKYGALTSAEDDVRRLTGMYKNWFLDSN